MLDNYRVTTYSDGKRIVKKAVEVIDFFRTSVPENINHYLEHRDLKTDDVIGITVDGGYFYV
ncbi:MAG: hypothetical protein ACXADW_24005, partial [Candidatus Hodarchaeales archaeon]